MPSRVRIISGPRNTAWDRYIRELVAQEGYERERIYFGIETQERADEVRRRMRTAGRHLGVSVKSYWKPCTGCQQGGPGCRFHVSYTAYDFAKAKAYKEQQAAAAQKP